MLRTIKYSEFDFNRFTQKRTVNLSRHEQTVKRIIDEVKREKDKAVIRFCREFDNTDLLKTGFKTNDGPIKKGYFQVLKKDPLFIQTVRDIIKRITTFHKHQIEKKFIIVNKDEVLGQLINPVEKILIYVPGGKAFYPSSLIMNTVPARLAGVKEICVTTPMRNNEKIRDEMLAVLYLLNIREIYHVGGAQAIAGFAFGTRHLPRVYKIFGPGNIFVTQAKKMLIGTIDIDMLAGPSEVVLIADKKADPENISLDMLAQAEHDTMSSSILITDSPALAKAVGLRIKRLLDEEKNSLASRSVKNCLAIIVHDMKQAFHVSNEIAPEHLEILLDKPFSFLPLVKNAGSVFLGENTPTVVGDYYAGPNHTLPTMGTAKFSSPLGVYDFIKRTSYIYFNRKKLKESSDYITKMAEVEGLRFHSLSVKRRK